MIDHIFLFQREIHASATCCMKRRLLPILRPWIFKRIERFYCSVLVVTCSWAVQTKRSRTQPTRSTRTIHFIGDFIRRARRSIPLVSLNRRLFSTIERTAAALIYRLSALVYKKQNSLFCVPLPLAPDPKSWCSLLARAQ